MIRIYKIKIVIRYLNKSNILIASKKVKNKKIYAENTARSVKTGEKINAA